MAKTMCSFHKEKPAVWLCDECTRDYCSDCVVVIAETGGLMPDPECTLCNAKLNYLGGGNQAKPFWSMAHVFFAYPFRPAGLMALGFLAFVGLFLNMGLFSIFAGLLSFAVILKYGVATLEAVAQGQTEPPSVNDAISGDEDNLFLKFVGIILLLGLVMAIVTILVGELFGTLLSLLISVLTPAMFVYLAIDRNISSALNPLKLIGLAVTIGPPYILVVLLSNVISTGPVFVLSTLNEVSQGFLIGPVILAVAGYFAIVYFALLGYMLYENQGKLGYVAGDPYDELLPDELANHRKQRFGEVNVLLREQRVEDAFKRFTEAPPMLLTDQIYVERYFSLALQMRHEKSVAHAADLTIELLIDKDAADAGLDQWRKARDVIADYLPRSPKARHRLAESALSRNLRREAFLLLVNLHKQHEDYVYLESAYRLLAKLLEEDGKSAEANRVLLYLQDRMKRGVTSQSSKQKSDAEVESNPTAKIVDKDADSSEWGLI